MKYDPGESYSEEDFRLAGVPSLDFRGARPTPVAYQSNETRYRVEQITVVSQSDVQEQYEPAAA